MTEPEHKSKTSAPSGLILDSSKTTILVGIVVLLIGVGLGIGIDKLSQPKGTGGSATSTTTGTSTSASTGSATTTGEAATTGSSTTDRTEQKAPVEPELTSTDPIKDGRVAFDKQNYALALKYFDLALQNTATKAEGYHWRGICYAASQLPESALADYDQALSLSPDSIAMHLDRAAAYYALRQHASAVKDYDAILQLDRNNADALFGRALANNAQHASDAALSDLNHLLSSSPSVRGYKLKGDIYYLARRWNEALQAYNQGLSITPGDLELKARRARTFLSGGKTKQGLKLFENVVDSSMRGDFRNDLAYACICDRQYERAIKILAFAKERWTSQILTQNMQFAAQRLIEQSTANIRRRRDVARSYALIAFSYMYIPDLESAEKYATEAVRLNPRDAFTYDILGDCQFEKDQFEAAYDSYSKALAINPKYQNALYGRAITAESLEKYQLSIADFEAYNLLEKNSVVYAAEASAYLHLEKYAEAEQCAKKSLEIDSHCTQAMSRYAQLMEKQHKYSDAVAWLNRSLSENPYDGKTYESRGLAYFQMNECDLALKDIQHALKLNPAAKYARYSLQMIQMIVGPPDALVETAKLGAKDFAPTERDYLFSASILPWYAFTQVGDTAQANQHLEDGLKRQTRGTKWPYALAEFVAGRQTAEQMLSTCTSNGERTEAHTWIGALLVLKGDKTKALDEFNWVFVNGIPTYLEASLAKAFTDKLTAESQKTAIQK